MVKPYFNRNLKPNFNDNYMKTDFIDTNSLYSIRRR